MANSKATPSLTYPIPPLVPRIHGVRSNRSKLIGIKGTPELHRRMRIAAAEEGLSYAQLFDMLLDLRDERLANQRKQQRHPLARPVV